MLCGYLPFEDENTEKLYKKIMDGEYEIPDFITPMSRELIKGILNVNPEKRFKVENIKGSA